jgi:basic membrane lipoprotein Med (substrate-binding protein (PBP1-ABC) superfamily)
VTSIAVVAAVADGAAEPESPSGLVWTGAQQAATTLGATATLAAPKSQLEAAGMVETAAAGGAGIVIAVGPDATSGAVTSAAAHPGTQFFMVDVAPPPGSPANLHGLVFDEAQAGYLAAIVATAYSSSGHVAMLGDSQADTRSANYLAGFRAGAPEGRAGATVTVSYAGTADSPEKARTAIDTMIKGKADVILALPDVSGIAAMREACARKALIVAADSDAWQLVPDVRPCLIASVRKRYDLEVAAAILGYASGAPPASTIVGDVAGREIEVTDLHIAAPAGLADHLASVLQVMRAQPAGASPTPASS